MLCNTMPCHATPRLAIPHRAVPILTCRPPDGTAADTNPEQHKRGMQFAAQGTVNKVLGESETIKGPEQIQRRELRRAGRHSLGTVPLRLGRAAGRKAGCLSVCLSVLQKLGWAGRGMSGPCPPRFCLSGPAMPALRGSHAHFRGAHRGDLRVSYFARSHTSRQGLSITPPKMCLLKHGAWESVFQPSLLSCTAPCGVSGPMGISTR